MLRRPFPSPIISRAGLRTSCRGSGGRSALPGPGSPLARAALPPPPASCSRPPGAASSAAAFAASAAASPRLWPAPAARGGGGLGSARRRGRDRARTLGPAVRAPRPAAAERRELEKPGRAPSQPPPQLLAGGSRRAFGTGLRQTRRAVSMLLKEPFPGGLDLPTAIISQRSFFGTLQLWAAEKIRRLLGAAQTRSSRTFSVWSLEI